MLTELGNLGITCRKVIGDAAVATTLTKRSLFVGLAAAVSYESYVPVKVVLYVSVTWFAAIGAVSNDNAFGLVDASGPWVANR